MQLEAFPWRLRNGAVVTVDQDSDGYLADAVARVALTRTGEWKPVPTYGVPDATFDAVNVAAINACLALHGPAVAVSLVKVDVDQRSQRATLHIERTA